MQTISKTCLLTIVFISMIQCIQAQQEDTIVLKNGLHKAGYIYKMEAGKIYITHEKDSSIYSADDVGMLMFCHTVRSTNDCEGKSTSNGRLAKSFSNSSGSSANHILREKDGDAQFTCTKCGGNGRIEIINTEHPGVVIDQFMVSLEEGESYFTYKASLSPGKYEWRYCDTKKNANKGGFIIEKDSTIQIAVIKP
mgnify:CR=1 FL=1